MRSRLISVAAIAALIGGTSATSAFADAAKPGQSMTHIKTEKGIASALESLGVILYVQGGATAAVIGESLASPDSQFVFHIPVTGSKANVEHTGSNIVFFNTKTKKVVQLRNPVIDLKQGVVSATIPQASGQTLPVLKIANVAELKAKATDDKKTKLRTSVYSGAKLSLAPGVAAVLTSLLGLTDGSLSEGLAFASADVTVYSQIRKK